MTLSRRRLLAAAAATSVLSAPAVHADRRGDDDHPIIGDGPMRFRCHHGWGRDTLPAGHRYGNASHGVAIDSEGLVYITHVGGPGSYFVFTPDGRFVRHGGAVHAAGTIHPDHAVGHGIDIRRENGRDMIYLSAAHPDGTFAKTTIDDEVVWSFGRDEVFRRAGVDPAEQRKFKPTNVSFLPETETGSGGYLLGDGYGDYRLYEFDADDHYVRTIGTPGEAAGELRMPHGHGWDPHHDATIVADRVNHRLQWFDTDGRSIRTTDGFRLPADIDTRDDWTVVPDLEARVTLLHRDGTRIELGDDEAWHDQVLSSNWQMRSWRDRWPAGRFVHPHDACFTPDGDLIVTEWVAGGRVTMLRAV